MKKHPTPDFRSIFANSTVRLAKANKRPSPPPTREVALLARTAWQREGCPPNGEQQCRLEVEIQLRATRHLLEREAGNDPDPADRADAKIL